MSAAVATEKAPESQEKKAAADTQAKEKDAAAEKAREELERQRQEAEQLARSNLQITRASAEEMIETTRKSSSQARGIAERIDSLTPDQARSVLMALASTLRREELGSLNHNLTIAVARPEAVTQSSASQATADALAAAGAGGSVVSAKSEVSSSTRAIEGGVGVVTHLASHIHEGLTENESADLIRDIKWVLRGVKNEELRLAAVAQRAEDQHRQEQALKDSEAERLRMLLATSSDEAVKAALRDWIEQQGAVTPQPRSIAA